MSDVGDTVEEINIIEKGNHGLIEEIASHNPYQGFRSYYRVRFTGKPPRTFVTPEEALEYYYLTAGEFASGEQINGLR